MLQLWLDFHVIFGVKRVLFGKVVDLPVQGVHQRPHEEQYYVHWQQAGDCDPQLPRDDLGLRIQKHRFVPKKIRKNNFSPQRESIPDRLALNLQGFTLVLGRQPMDPPDFAEHGAVRQTEPQGQQPGAEGASDGEGVGAHESPVKSCRDDIGPNYILLASTSEMFMHDARRKTYL